MTSPSSSKEALTPISVLNSVHICLSSPEGIFSLIFLEWNGERRKGGGWRERERDRERGRERGEGKGEGGKHGCQGETSILDRTGDGTCNPDTAPDRELNPRTFSRRNGAVTTEHTSQGKI